MIGLRAIVLASVLAVTAGGASAQIIIANSGFENGQLAAGTYLYPNGNYQSWYYGAPNGNGSALVNAQGYNDFYGAKAPTGTRGDQFAALQRDSVIRQDIIVATAGKYQFTWLSAGRPSSADGLANGKETYTFALLTGLPSSPVKSLTTANFSTTTGSAFGDNYISYNLTPGSYTLQFAGTAATDQTAFLDNVGVRALPGAPVPTVQPTFGFAGAGVPEGPVWAMLIAGFGLVGLARRRRLPALSA